MTKIAVVTGAGTGIGAAAATALASDGWPVVLAGRRRTRLDELAAAHPELLLDPVPTDVTDEASVRNLFEVTVARAWSSRPALQQCRHGRAAARSRRNSAGRVAGRRQRQSDRRLPLYPGGVRRHAADSSHRAAASSTTARSPRMRRVRDRLPTPRPSTPLPASPSRPLLTDARTTSPAARSISATRPPT